MCLFNWPQTQLANISKTINPQFCLQDEHWWMMTVRAGRKPTCIQTTWFNIVIFNLNAILFFLLTHKISFLICCEKQNCAKRELRWPKAFHALSEWQEFHSRITFHNKQTSFSQCSDNILTLITRDAPAATVPSGCCWQTQAFSLSWMGTRQILHFHYSSMAFPSGGAWARAERLDLCFGKSASEPQLEPQPEINTTLPHHPHT